MINSLQALRAVAALAVFLFHLVPILERSGSTLPTRLFEWGFLGVDVFFVLSGVVLTLSTAGKTSSIGQTRKFLTRRFIRIYAGYWPFLLVMSVVILAVGVARENSAHIAHSIFLTSFDPTELALPVSWTLSYELYFYLVFGLGLLIRPAYRLPLVLCYASLIIFLNIGQQNTDASGPFFLTPFILEFMMGWCLGELYKRNYLKPWHRPSWLICVPLFLLGVYLNANSDLPRIMTFGLGSAFLVCAFLGTDRIWSTRAGNYIVRLGDASFTLYLCHTIFIHLFHRSNFWRALADSNVLLTNICNLIFLLAVCLFSYAFFLRVESPVYRWLTNSERRWMV